jgi:hypothetical protein
MVEPFGVLASGVHVEVRTSSTQSCEQLFRRRNPTMTLLEVVKGRLAAAIARYGLRVVEDGPYLVYLVVSAASVMSIVSHPSEGVLNCRWYIQRRGIWNTAMVLELLWARSAMKVPASVLESTTGMLDKEMAALAWKLEEAGTDVLSGGLDWLSEYERKVGSAECVVGERAMKLSGL